MCWDTTSYGSKDGRSDAPATATRISRPHRRTAVPPSAKGSFAKRLDADGLTMGKGADIFTLVSRGHRSDRMPPPEEPSESPRHFAASMDESVIVGYYTLKKCRSSALPLSVNLKERKRQWQETME